MLTYDATGNLASRTGDVGTTYAFDAANQLRSVTAGASTSTFTYDGDGGRTKVVDGTGTTRFLGGLYEKLPTGSTGKSIVVSHRHSSGNLTPQYFRTSGTFQFFRGGERENRSVPVLKFLPIVGN